MKTLLKNARCIVTCDDRDSILRGGDVLMQDGVIAAIGTLDQTGADEVIDASRLILYPGLIIRTITCINISRGICDTCRIWSYSTGSPRSMISGRT